MAILQGRLRHLLVWCVVLGLAPLASAQLPASFQIPMMGYVFDASSRGIRPIAGIPGSSRLDVPLLLPMSIERVCFLPDQWHAIVGSTELTDVAVVDLRELKTLPISGAPSSVTEIRTSPGGSVAALYYAATARIVVVNGLPDMPVIRNTINVSVVSGTLKHFAISDDGAALLGFSSPDEDTLYSWTVSAGLRYVSKASRISSMAFLGTDAVYADGGSDQAFLIRNVRENSSPALIADSGDGVSHPTAVYGTVRNEILIGNSDGLILVLDASGLLLRKILCNCAITSLAPLEKSAFRLTDRTDQPLYVLDGLQDGLNAGQVFFIPALPVEAESGAGQ